MTATLSRAASWALFLLLPTLLVGQDPAQLLDKSRTKLNTTRDLEITFKKSAEFVNGGAGSEYTGTLKRQGNAFKLDIQDQTVLNTGQAQYAINHADNEITITENDPESALTPDRLFALTTDNMRSSYGGTEAVGGRSCHKLMLFPLGQADYASITIWLDTQENLPRKILTRYKNGTKITYTVQQLKLNPGFSETAFEFQPALYLTYRIEDLR